MKKTVIRVLLLLAAIAELGACGASSKFDGNAEYKFSMVSPSVETATLSEQLAVSLSNESGNIVLQLRPACQIQGQGTNNGGNIREPYPCQITLDSNNSFSVVFNSGAWTVSSEEKSTDARCTTTDKTLSVNAGGTFAGIVQSKVGSGNFSLSFTGHSISTDCESIDRCGAVSGLAACQALP